MEDLFASTVLMHFRVGGYRGVEHPEGEVPRMGS